MKTILFTLSILFLFSCQSEAQKSIEITATRSLYDISFRDQNFKERKLKDYQAKVLLIVNVASECGFTPQYEPLQKIYEKYQKHGLEILAFPCNDFMGQEPGDTQSIQAFAKENFGATFPIMTKIHVKGNKQAELYRYLTQEIEPSLSGSIKWNFTKFLIDRTGIVQYRFSPNTQPDAQEVIEAIEKLLQQ